MTNLIIADITATDLHQIGQTLRTAGRWCSIEYSQAKSVFTIQIGDEDTAGTFLECYGEGSDQRLPVAYQKAVDQLERVP